MRNRNVRDAERRNYIKEKIIENLECVKNDPQSLFKRGIQDDSKKY